MRFSVVCLMRQGRALEREGRARQVPKTGCLRVEGHPLAGRGRMARAARLLAEERAIDPDELPPLFEPQLVPMSPLAFTLAGFELIEGVAFAQSWLVREAAQRGALHTGFGAGWAAIPQPAGTVVDR